MPQISSRRIAPVLGVLGSLGPLSIDMYLPAMPQIAEKLNVGEGAVQFSLMAFFAGLMIGQLFYGPVSDRTGRKPVIYVGLTLFIVASIGCASAATAGQLTAWRFAQGLGGSIGMVISLAVVRDLFTGRTAAGLMALMMIVRGLAPVLAPLLGTAVISVAPWQGIFVTLAVFGGVCILLVAAALPETRPHELRVASHPLEIMRAYGRLIIDRNFIPYVGALSLAMAGFFAYLTGSSFLFISVYGLAPITYSALIAANALGLIVGGQIAPRLLGRFSGPAIVRTALGVYAAASVLLAVLELAGTGGLWASAILLFTVITAFAFVLPLTSVLALEAYGTISGTASALLGALQFGAGTLASFIVGVTANGTGSSMIATIAACGFAASLVAFKAFPNAATAPLKETTS